MNFLKCYGESFFFQLSTQYKKVLNQLQEEQAMNRSLLNNQQHWQSAVQRLEEDKQKQEKVLIFHILFTFHIIIYVSTAKGLILVKKILL